MSVTLCHLADIHLGFRRYYRVTKDGLNQREVDVNLAFQEAIRKVIKINPAVVVIAGDLFHSVRPSNYTLAFAFRQIKLLVEATNSYVVIVAGNHDSPRRNESGSVLRILAEIPRVLVADYRPEKFKLPHIDTTVTCLPHRALLDGALKKGMPCNMRASEETKYNILVTHGQFSADLVTDFGGVDLALEELELHAWDYVALGHIHLASQVKRNAAYSGSIEHTATNIWKHCTVDKGFFEVSLSPLRLCFHAINSVRQAIQLPTVDALGLSVAELNELIEASICSIPSGIAGKLIRLEVHNVERSVARLLDHRKLRTWKAEALHLALELHAPASNLQIPQKGQFLGASLERKNFLQQKMTEFIADRVSNQKLSERYQQLAIEYYKNAREQDEAP